jgi:putative FmdB family regulatory protein
MPTYEYQCLVCGHRFEKFQRMSDDPERQCPECGGKVKRLFSVGMGFIIKGQSDFTNRPSGKTCCGRTERCDKPPCSDDQRCTS